MLDHMDDLTSIVVVLTHTMEAIKQLFLKSTGQRNLIITLVTSVSLFIITCIYTYRLKSSSRQQSKTTTTTNDEHKQSSTISTPSKNNNNNNNQHVASTNESAASSSTTPKKIVNEKSPAKPQQQQQQQVTRSLQKVIDPINLPHSILMIIFEQLSFKDYQRSKKVSRNWNKVLNKIDRIWMGYSMDKWGYNNIPLPTTEDEQIDYFKFFKSKYREEQKRIGFEPEKYIISIFEQCADFTESSRWKMEKVICSSSWWKKRLVEEMNTSLTLSKLELTERNPNIINAPGAILVGNIIDQSDGNTIVGKFRFIDTYDASIKFETEKWIGKTIDCPWTGDLVGYFNWTLYPLENQFYDDDKKNGKFTDEGSVDRQFEEKYKTLVVEFLRTLTYETRGIVSRIGTGITAKSVVYESCKLSSVFGKYGMNDGDCLIDTDETSSYIVTLIDTIQHFLDKKQVEGCKVVYTSQTSHNPIRYTGHITKEILSLQISIWIYNTIILSNRKLWGKKLD
ncbi:cyclin-like F-box containing protein [Cavenderia fasciculata]|uniref:Cyclin-like F-box containing protein n=1 Tax=Cavenderia fasciculata TaxID=261658 RepID=F4Q3B6_CACFS|nr:cyclin-like F-box containing protein [Cavenderia fasciculata]EGG17626.1 cyclin-like F-box containing protein [Cavenderia fasciculata]|eukprot:XP_004356110.1 cyclin-like F-box containing protein [Cavenderia fasciculata]